MAEFEFGSLLAAIAHPDGPLVLGPHLSIAGAPNPFVAPTLRTEDDPRSQLEREVLFIAASAAVGKSTVARHLSNSCRIPLLDLAVVPVSTGTLKALLVDIAGIPDPVAAFHAGALPIVIDALDEGRLLSGETGLESFMDTTATFLRENRSVTHRPKIIFLGRYESIELARLGLEIGSSDIQIGSTELGFFGRDAAWSLIKAHGDALAEPGSQYRQHPEPVRTLTQAYFDAIEAALGLPKGELWTTEAGRAFAGYAPVLAALGTLLARMDNFQEVTNRLNATGAREAWAVVEEVLNGITDREQGKLREKLLAQVTGPLSEDVYSPREQLRLLYQHIHGMVLQSENISRLRGADANKYRTMIDQQLPEHPFVRHQEFRNPVLGSFVMAHAIINGHTKESNTDRLAELSRQPFLWRTLSSKLTMDSLIDGHDLGYILNSFWNDPLSSGRRVIIRESDTDELLKVYVPIGHNEEVVFSVVEPITFFGQMRACDIDIPAEIRFLGYAPRGSASVFYIRGECTLFCSFLKVETDSLRFDGEVWLEAVDFAVPSRLAMFPNGAKLGWGAGLCGRFPWNTIEANLRAPYDPVVQSILEALLQEGARRFEQGVAPTLYPDYSPAEDDPHMRWVRRQFPTAFPALIGLLLKHGLAESDSIPAAGQGKVRIRFGVRWDELLAALNNPGVGSQQIRNCLVEAQEIIR